MTVPTFIDGPRFELLRGWLSEVEPDYEVDIGQVGAFAEVRNVVSEAPRTRITVTIPPDRVSDIPLVRRFWHVCRGTAVGFRVQDPTDYVTTAQGFVNDASDPQPSAYDAPLVATADPTKFELWKRYTISEGSLVYTIERRILKPVSGTILVANNTATPILAPSNWSIDYTTGVLTKLGGFTGTPATWGGQFDLPVRFDGRLKLRMEDFRLDSLTFELLELRDDA